MTLTIHRGTHEIGGSCIELTTSDSRLFLDFGLPLVDREGNPLVFKKKVDHTYQNLIDSGIAPSIPYFCKGGDEKPTSLLLTHSHLDHYGLSPWLPPKIPVYSSWGTKKLLETAHYFSQSSFDPIDVNILEPWKPIRIGGFSVTPYLADHSAVDAFSYLIETEGRRIFYSGDIRAHGRKKVLFEHLLSDPPKNIDYLVLEGSMLGRETSEYTSEKDIERKLTEELSNDGFYIASFSSQNIDRFVSFFKACRSTGRTLVIDPYSASILDALRDISPHIPQYTWQDGFKVFFVQNSYTGKMAEDKTLFKYKNSKIMLGEMLADPSRVIIKENFKIRKILRKTGILKNAKLIHSMWDGYLKDDQFWKTNEVPIIKIHCSGHAYKEDLIRLVEAVKPKKAIPNHTFRPNDFNSFFGDRALILNDGQTLEC